MIRQIVAFVRDPYAWTAFLLLGFCYVIGIAAYFFVKAAWS